MTTVPDDAIARLQDFFASHYRGYRLEPDEEIFSLGFVNSLFALQLVEFVETEFGARVETEDLEIENFQTLRAIRNLVEQKAAADRAA